MCVCMYVCMDPHLSIAQRISIDPFTSARDARGRACVCRFARVCRRRHVEMPYGQRAVGCAFWAHDRDRRSRHHLRHRRHRHQRHPLPGRVGEHRRRCAAGLARGGWGVLVGYSRGITGGTRGVVQGYPGGSHQADPPTHAFQTFAPVALPPSQDMQMQLPMLFITCMACMSLGKNCVRVGSCGRARPRVC